MAYEYYWIGIYYEKGRITPYILEGNHIIKMKDLSNWWEEIDLSDWVSDIIYEIKLRIPDKYLDAKGLK